MAKGINIKIPFFIRKNIQAYGQMNHGHLRPTARIQYTQLMLEVVGGYLLLVFWEHPRSSFRYKSRFLKFGHWSILLPVFSFFLLSYDLIVFVENPETKVIAYLRWKYTKIIWQNTTLPTGNAQLNLNRKELSNVKTGHLLKGFVRNCIGFISAGKIILKFSELGSDA